MEDYRGSAKKFRGNPVFDLNLHPVPKNLQKSLDIIANTFNSSYLRNMEIMDPNRSRRIYGLMTNYESGNYCWIQPTPIKSVETPLEYDRYMRRVNSHAKSGDLERFTTIQEGIDCVAQYDVDNNWYRAVTVNALPNDRWSVMFIDFGNFQICSSHQIAKPIHLDFTGHYRAPVQAVCCRLYNVIPRLPQNREEIDRKLEEFFSKNSRNFLEIVVRNVRIDYVVDCDIFLTQRGCVGPERLFRRHIGQEMVDSGIATFVDPVAAWAIKPPKDEPTEVPIDIDEEDDDEDHLVHKSEKKFGDFVKVE